MSNFTIKPNSGADRARITSWADRNNVAIENNQDVNGNIVFNFSTNDLRATTTFSDLKRIATFDNVSEE